MINYQVFGLAGAIMLIEQERRVIGAKAAILKSVGSFAPHSYESTQHIHQYALTAQDCRRIEGLLKFLLTLCQQLNLESTESRIHHFTRKMRNPTVDAVVIGAEVETLSEALHDDIRFKYFYHYPDEKAKRLLRFQADWAAPLEKFPSIKDDAEAATDCFSLGRNDASVFHSMRVLECGIKVLAADVDLSFGTEQWYNILNNIDGKIEEIRHHGIPGIDKAAKDARLQFLSEAAKEFFYFKDGWRNYVSHGRSKYDEHQALGVLEHVRALMTHLSTRLSEVP